MRFGHLTEGQVHSSRWRLTTGELRAGQPVTSLTHAIRRYAKERRLALQSIVMGVPVSLGLEHDLVLSSTNIPGLEGLQLATLLRRELNCPVRLERDITLLLMGEWLVGAARQSRSSLGVFIGTGVGASFLNGPRPFRGHSGAALELGHIPVGSEGRLCVCGNFDCLEAYASGHVLRALAQEHQVELASIFEQGHPAELRKRLDMFVRYLALAVATAINLFDPQTTVVGGGIPRMSGFPRGLFRRFVFAHLRQPIPARAVSLRWAELGWQAALHGARLLTKDVPESA
jgi:allose kinase